MQESENILRILEGTKEAMQNGDIGKIKELSNQTNNTASRTHDPDNIAIAVIVYSFGKILERGDYKEHRGWEKFYNNILVYLDKVIDSLKKNDSKGVSRSLELIRGEIENLSGKFKKYVKDVFRKASINRASKIYEHGISMEKTAKLLGVTMFELAAYSGQKQDDEYLESRTTETRRRIKIVEGLFG